MPDKEHIVAVASTNPVKVAAAAEGLRRMFPHLAFVVRPVGVLSGVADQPLTDEETLLGATNRVANAVSACPEASFWLGIEGGVQWQAGELSAFAWVVVRGPGGLGRARSGTFFLPSAVAALVAQGLELGAADDQVFGQTNSKQAAGAIGLLTGNVVDRRQLYEQAVVLALVRFKNEALYAEAAGPAPGR